MARNPSYYREGAELLHKLLSSLGGSKQTQKQSSSGRSYDFPSRSDVSISIFIVLFLRNKLTARSRATLHSVNLEVDDSRDALALLDSVEDHWLLR